jgi:formate hydrogenlyase subunit 6/NADH:ubiquinone oxidoreductase subunit I
VTTTYPEQITAPQRGIHGTPVLNVDRCDLTAACQAACPTGAILITGDPAGAGSWQIDYGNCIFCGACMQACPRGAISSSEAFELSARRREETVVLYSLSSRGGA